MNNNWMAFRRGFMDGLGLGFFWRWLARKLEKMK
jgi:hypothetical protein